MNKKSSSLLLLFLLLYTISSNIFSQIIGGYGLKSGFTSAWQTEYILGSKLEGIDNRNSIFIGLYADWFKSPWYSFNTEFCYSSKGMKTEIPFTTVQHPNGTGEFIKGNINLSYFSVIILPSVYTEIKNIRIYTFAGPRFDIEISKSINVQGPEPSRTYYFEGVENQLRNYSSIQFGLTIGLGIQLNKILPFPLGVEARYNPDISKVYETEFIYIKNNSVDFLLKIEL